MSKRDKKTITLGSGDLMVKEYDGSNFPAYTDFDPKTDLLGYISKGATLEYKGTWYEVSDDTGKVCKTILTKEDATLKSGVLTWNGNTLAKLCSTARVTEEGYIRKLIADTLNNTYGESKAIYDSLNGSIVEQNRAELELRNTQALLGEAMRPVNTVLTELKTQILIAITPLVLALADAFLNLLTWLKEHPAVLYTVIAAVLREVIL